MRILASLLLIFSAVACDTPPKFNFNQFVSHRIGFLDQNDSLDSYCSMTAIGPSTFLTGTHCNDVDTRVRVDLDTHVYHIIASVDDGHDHTIYKLAESPFVLYRELRYRKARIGEHVYMYGSGLGKYPPRRLDGIVVKKFDPSDVDFQAGRATFNLQTIPGDSGSAIYGEDGAIVALVTYGHVEEHWYGDQNFSIGFSLAFNGILK